MADYEDDYFHNFINTIEIVKNNAVVINIIDII